MLNHIEIQGRLTKDPEMRTTQSGVQVASFTLAVDRDFQRDSVDFVPCVAWRQNAEFIGRYFRKGNLMVACGSLQSNSWTDRDNNKRTSWAVQVDRAYFCESKKDSGDGYAAGEPNFTPPKAPNVIADDEDLPF